MASIIEGEFEHVELGQAGERLRMTFRVIERDLGNPTVFTCQITEVCVWDAEGELMQRWPEELEEVCGGTEEKEEVAG